MDATFPRPLWLASTLALSACASGDVTAQIHPSSAGAPALPGAPTALATTATAQPQAARAFAPAQAPLSVVDAQGVKASLVAAALLSDAGGGRQHLIGVDWEIPGGTEQYLCARFVMPEDVYISAYYPLNPPGTHHTALTVRDVPNAPDGVTECDISEVGTQNLGGSANGTTGGPLPAGVAMKFPRGSQIVLNLHLLNANNAPITGQSGAQVVSTRADAVQILADGVAAGPLKLSVPPGGLR